MPAFKIFFPSRFLIRGRITWRGLIEVMVLLLAGTIIGVGGYFVWTLFSRPFYEFGVPEVIYSPEQPQLVLSVQYTYRGGCERIQWSHVIALGTEIHLLGVYDGPPRFTRIGEGQVYKNIIVLSEPLPPGTHEWRGTIVCTDSNKRQHQYVTNLNWIHVPEDETEGPYIVPYDWSE